MFQRHPEIGASAFRARLDLRQQLAAVVEHRVYVEAPAEQRARSASMAAAVGVSAVQIAHHTADQDLDAAALERDALMLVDDVVHVLR